MQDEMTITVIAAGFDIDDDASEAGEKASTEEPIQVDNPLIQDVKVSGGKPSAPVQPQAQPRSSAMDDDLTAIFNILDRH